MELRVLILAAAFAFSCAPNSSNGSSSEEFFEPKTFGEASNLQETQLFNRTVILHKLDESITPDEETEKLLRGPVVGMELRVEVISTDHRLLEVPFRDLGQRTFYRGFGGPWESDPLHMFECDWTNKIRVYEFNEHLIACRGKYFFSVFVGDTDSEVPDIPEPYQSWWAETVDRAREGRGVRRSLKLYTCLLYTSPSPRDS